jgi:ankyrin repeat protein
MLHYAVILSNIEEPIIKPSQSDTYLKSIDSLIRGGSEINLVNKLGETPLHLCRNCSVVDLLLSYGAQMNVKEITGKTPLFTYFCRANYDMCIELLKHGSELEIIDRLGNSLLYAVIHSNAPIKFIVLLLQAGVCLNKEKWLIERIFPTRLRNRYPKLISFIEWQARNPLSLKEQCRKTIRNHLNFVNKNKSLLKRVLHLPVPNVLQDYILFNLK